MSAALSFRGAAAADVPGILALQLAADAHEEARFGKDRWSTKISEASVIRGMKSSRVLVALRRNKIAAALRLATKKPWAIDITYFTPVAKAAYLHDVAVDPAVQREGIGRSLLAYTTTTARALGFNALRLDAYDGASGGGPFYAKCGFREVGRVVYRKVPLIYYELVL